MADIETGTADHQHFPYTIRVGVRFGLLTALPGHQLPDIVIRVSDTDDGLSHQSKYILICEDDADIARLLKLMLAQQGYKSDVAYSAAQARTMLAQKQYDALTLDIILPDDEGGAFLKELREMPGSSDIPIVVVSAVADQTRQALNGGALGVVDWLSKPIDENRLEKAIQTALSHSLQHPRILHVEDEEDIFTVTSLICQEMADVEHARNYRDALAKLQERRYDLVILDIGLPDGNGYNLIPEIRKMPGDPVPVIIYSASETTKSMAEQVDAALVKSSTTIDMLQKTIETLINPERI